MLVSEKVYNKHIYIYISYNHVYIYIYVYIVYTQHMCWKTQKKTEEKNTHPKKNQSQFQLSTSHFPKEKKHGGNFLIPCRFWVPSPATSHTLVKETR